MISNAMFQSNPMLTGLFGTARASGARKRRRKAGTKAAGTRKGKKKAAAPRARASKKPARLVKGSAAAKAYMAKIRRKKK